MSFLYYDLKNRIETKKYSSFNDIYCEVAAAYEKGRIDCNQYLALYDILKLDSIA